MADAADKAADSGSASGAPASDAIRQDNNGAVLINEGDVKKEETPAPKKYAGKYDSDTELEKAYLELQKQLGAKKEPTTPKIEEKPKELTPTEVQAKAKEAGIDLDSVAKEFFDNNNALTDETYAKLEKAGFAREAVDRHIEGQLALNEKVTAEIAKPFGGEEQMQQAFKWAETNLSEADVATYNEAFASGDLKRIAMASRALRSQYVEANGQEPALVGGEPAPGVSGVKPYESHAELMRDMRDERYKSGDVAFHRQVQARLEKADLFSVHVVES